MRRWVVALTALALLCLAQPVSAEEPRAVSTPQRAMQVRSKPLIVGGAIVTGVGLSVLSYGVLTAWGESFCRSFSGPSRFDAPGEGEGELEFVYDGSGRCDKGADVMLATGLVLTFLGVPAIVIGAQRVPAKPPLRALLVPLAVRKGAGLALRLEL